MKKTSFVEAKGGAMFVYIILAIIFILLLWGLMRIRRKSA
jgi:flagellar biogenesis protein FliO